MVLRGLGAVRIRNGVLAAATAAAFVVAPAAPASAYHYDCEFMGTQFLVHDTVDCVYWIYLHLIP